MCVYGHFNFFIYGLSRGLRIYLQSPRCLLWQHHWLCTLQQGIKGTGAGWIVCYKNWQGSNLPPLYPKLKIHIFLEMGFKFLNIYETKWISAGEYFSTKMVRICRFCYSSVYFTLYCLYIIFVIFLKFFMTYIHKNN